MMDVLYLYNIDTWTLMMYIIPHSDMVSFYIDDMYYLFVMIVIYVFWDDLWLVIWQIAFR